MATPTGAEHRDLEQRLRNIENALRQIAGQALRRKQLSVTSGDFVVSGGGGVVVEDGGSVTVEETGRLESLYADGSPAVTIGGFTAIDSDTPGALVQLLEEDGSTVVLQVFRQSPAPAIPTGHNSATVRVDDFSLTSDSGIFMGGNGLSNWLLTGGLDVSGGLNADDVFVSPRGTTGSAANVRFNASGRLLEVTSSRRWKQDIKDAPDRADNLLQVQGRTWRDKGAAADDKAVRHVGYIAEELHDAGLTEYVEYDDDGLPKAIAYDRLTVPLVQLAQRQAGQIADLTERLEALEAKV